MVVFNEINYHLASGSAAPQWLELFNQMTADVDLSGWSIQGGAITNSRGTILPGGYYLVVATSPSALQSAAGISGVLGPLVGNLAGRATLVLRNNDGRIMESIDFGQDDPWPVGPDGGGVTLAKKSPQLPSTDAANWTFSAVGRHARQAELRQRLDP